MQFEFSCVFYLISYRHDNLKCIYQSKFEIKAKTYETSEECVWSFDRITNIIFFNYINWKRQRATRRKIEPQKFYRISIAVVCSAILIRVYSTPIDREWMVMDGPKRSKYWIAHKKKLPNHSDRRNLYIFYGIWCLLCNIDDNTTNNIKHQQQQSCPYTLKKEHSRSFKDLLLSHSFLNMLSFAFAVHRRWWPLLSDIITPSHYTIKRRNPDDGATVMWSGRSPMYTLSNISYARTPRSMESIL